MLKRVAKIIPSKPPCQKEFLGVINNALNPFWVQANLLICFILPGVTGICQFPNMYKVTAPGNWLKYSICSLYRRVVLFCKSVYFVLSILLHYAVYFFSQTLIYCSLGFPLFLPSKPPDMISVERFVFNDFQTNTYILNAGGADCIVVDCACQHPQEWMQLQSFLDQRKWKPNLAVHTHCHVDHMIGHHYLVDHYNLGYKVHSASGLFLSMAREFASVFGITLAKVYEPEGFLEDGDILHLGLHTLRVLYTPGHADGSVCFYCEEEGFLIAGDVLFRDSIGRTDLPTGNYDRLKDSITRVLFTLPSETIVYPGHGPSTTIGYEKSNNPFL